MVLLQPSFPFLLLLLLLLFDCLSFGSFRFGGQRSDRKHAFFLGLSSPLLLLLLRRLLLMLLRRLLLMLLLKLLMLLMLLMLLLPR